MEEAQEKDTEKQSWREKINFNVFGAVFFILFAIIFYILIPYQIAKPKLFHGRSLVDMQPTLFPRVIIIVLLGLSVWYLFQSFHLKEKNLFKDLPAKGYIKIVASVLVFVAYATLFDILGFVISSVIMVGILAPYYGYRNWVIYVLTSVGIPLIVYYMFTSVLKVSLPPGPFF